MRMMRGRRSLPTRSSVEPLKYGSILGVPLNTFPCRFLPEAHGLLVFADIESNQREQTDSLGEILGLSGIRQPLPPGDCAPTGGHQVHVEWVASFPMAHHNSIHPAIQLPSLTF